CPWASRCWDRASEKTRCSPRRVPSKRARSFRMRFRPRWRELLAAAAALGLAAVPARASEKTVVVSREIRVSIASGDEITLSARPIPGEGRDAVVQGVTDE